MPQIGVSDTIVHVTVNPLNGALHRRYVQSGQQP